MKNSQSVSQSVSLSLKHFTYFSILIIFAFFSISCQNQDIKGGSGLEFTIGGEVSGLEGSGLELSLNENIKKSITENGKFVFSDNKVKDGATYEITILTQPSDPVQICSLENKAGTVKEKDITDVTVTCAAPDSFTVSGTITGLWGSITLKNNGGDNLTKSNTVVGDIGNSVAFSFTTAIAESTVYAVTVGDQPVDQTCAVANDTGTISAAVSNVMVTCEFRPGTLDPTFGTNGMFTHNNAAGGEWI